MCSSFYSFAGQKEDYFLTFCGHLVTMRRPVGGATTMEGISVIAVSAATAGSLLAGNVEL